MFVDEGKARKVLMADSNERATILEKYGFSRRVLSKLVRSKTNATLSRNCKIFS